MRFPQEVVVQRFLPTYRSMLVQALSEEGLSQRSIADLVGVTQAQVSKYLAGKIEHLPRVAEDPRVRELVDAVAGGLAQGTMDTVDALGESLGLIRRLQNNGPLTELHVEEMPQLKGTGFDATVEPGSVAMVEHRVLTELRLALRRIEGIGGLAHWIPHVGTNVAQARPGAETIWDVAALPGRIDAVGDSVRVTTEPRFGGSRHVATTVLAVMDVDPGHRAALNLAFDPDLLDLAEAAGLGTLAIDAGYDGRREHVADRLATVAGDGQALPAVVYHEGAFGIEPVAYVLAEDALALVDRVSDLVDPS